MIPRLLALAFFTAMFITVALSSNASPNIDPPPTTSAEPLEAAGLAEARHWKQRWAARGRIIRAQRRLARRLIRSRPIGNHWLERAFLCVKAGEGAWTSNTGNGYQGGLQMDSSFQRAYGAEWLRVFGPAHRWPAAVQITVGIRGWLRRGFQPWPNTARACGLR